MRVIIAQSKLQQLVHAGEVVDFSSGVKGARRVVRGVWCVVHGAIHDSDYRHGG